MVVQEVTWDGVESNPPIYRVQCLLAQQKCTNIRSGIQPQLHTHIARCKPY